MDGKLYTEEVENSDNKNSVGSLKYRESSVSDAASDATVAREPTAPSPDIPDSTSDLLVDPAAPAPPSPAPSPGVTSSQPHGRRHRPLCEIDVVDGTGIHGIDSPPDALSDSNRVDKIVTDVKKKCYEAYVSVPNSGPSLATSKYYCAECQTLFVTEDAIASHRMTDHASTLETETEKSVGRAREKSLHACHHCSANFTTSSNMLRHVRTVHRAKETPSKSTSAPDNDDPALSVKELGSRNPTVEESALRAPDKTHLCQICKATFFLLEDLIVHVYEHTDLNIVPKTPMYRCEFCEARFTQKTFLERHLFSHARSRHSGPPAASGGAESRDRDATVAGSRSLDPALARGSADARSQDSSPRVSSGRAASTVRDEAVGGTGNAAARPRARSTAVASRAINSCLLESEHSARQSSPSGESLDSASTAVGEYWKCPVCALYLLSKYTYTHHMRVVHQKPPGPLPPCTAAVTTCPKCGLSLDSVGRYNIHIRNVHIVYTCSKCRSKLSGYGKFHHHKINCDKKKIVPKNANRAGLAPKNSVLKVHQVFKCSICDRSFSGRAAASSHRRSRHPGSPETIIVQNTQKLILKKSSPIGVPNPHLSIKTIKKPKGPETQSTVNVEKTNTEEKSFTLLQCEKCKHHFVTAIGLKLHMTKSDSCKQATCKTEVCKLCGLVFTKDPLRSHIEQHSLSARPLAAWDFAVTTASGAPVVFDRREAVARLPRCRRCGITFNSLFRVCKERCHDVKAVRCKPCDATFSTIAYNWHLVLHRRKNASAPSTARKKPANKSNKFIVRESKAQSIENKGNNSNLTLLRCEVCKVHMKQGTGAVSSHRKTNCDILMPKMICPWCGLTFTARSIGPHNALHKRSAAAALTMASFTILGMSDAKPVRPELCPFPACARCGVRAESEVVAFHRSPTDCEKVSTIECHTCRLTFTAVAHPLHVGYYGCQSGPKRKEAKRKLEQTKLDEYFPKPIVPPEVERSEEMATILDKYAQATHESWTQLYRCRECDMVVDSYDEVVEHCERHRERGFESSFFTCHVCDLRFEDASFTRHKELHFARPGLDCSSFEVMDYRSEQYGTRGWIAYKYSFTGDKIAYELLQPGPERHTLYRCACGKHCAGRVAAYRHGMSAENCHEPAEDCAVCLLPFQRSSLAAHAADHARHPHLAADACRIFGFRLADGPRHIPNPLKRKLEVPEAPVKLSKKIALTTLYKCAKCDAHFFSERKAIDHLRRSPNAHLRHLHKICDLCGFLFTRKNFNHHFVLHHRKKLMNGDDFEVKTIGKETNERVDSYSAPKLSAKTAPPDSLSGKDTKLTLFKCGKCDAHFFTETQAKRHLYSADIFHTRRAHRICDACGLEFTYKMFSRHYTQHHEIKKYGRENFRVKTLQTEKLKMQTKKKPGISVTKQPSKVLNNTGTRTILYKCYKCSANFLNNAQARKHLSRCTHTHNKGCTSCNFEFKFKTLKLHTALHHGKKKLKREDFRTITVVPRSLRQTEAKEDPPKVSSTKRRVQKSAKQMKAVIRKLYAFEIKANMPTLYKCSDCGLHYIKKAQIHKHWRKHKGATPSKKYSNRTCKDCGLLFPIRIWRHHCVLHHQLVQCVRTDYTVNIMKGCDIVSVEPATTRRAPQRNKIVLGSALATESASENLAVKSDIDPKGMLQYRHKNGRFTEKNGKGMLEYRHTNGRFTEKNGNTNPNSSQQTATVYTVYKCSACPICYLLLKSMQYHSIGPHPSNTPTEECTLCHLVFTQQVLPKHMSLHHKGGRVDPYRIIEVEPNPAKVKRESAFTGKEPKMENHEKFEEAETTGLLNANDNGLHENLNVNEEEVIILSDG